LTGKKAFGAASVDKLIRARLLEDSRRSSISSPPAKVSFQRALALARGQQARLWEVRAATSLAHLWRDQGRRTEARELLAVP
jgi:hypothetical protein